MVGNMVGVGGPTIRSGCLPISGYLTTIFTWQKLKRATIWRWLSLHWSWIGKSFCRRSRQHFESGCRKANISQKKILKTFFCSLLRAVGYPWSLGIFQENQSPKQKYFATDKPVNFINFMLIKNRGSENCRYCYTCLTSSLNSLFVCLIKIRQITRDMLCESAFVHLIGAFYFFI